ncbi:Quinol monooxygenase YgiN [Microbulbifer donghaiensis]|uniref:Quinol monooxygenase YgiN n=1 Tax=Microbulbifer donghaiensis TaxID=494016 RepID=A0A1M4UV51_9GAMM|nr:putative quinol monooxygenase [Microbulbifer donghaiensis]SHE60582.1 Quinol monooxygenase YgiN [Microbulbifer donghaiensis]
MIYLVATIKTKPGCRDKVLSELLRVQPTVKKEEGCLQYEPLVDEVKLVPRQADYREDVVTVVEQWASVAHLEAHFATAHMQEYGQVVEPWVADVSLQLLRENID